MKMKTTFALLQQTCGLSIQEAAAFLKVRPDTVKSWRSGRNAAPESVIAELRGLFAKIGNAADNQIALINKKLREFGTPPAEIELGLASDDYEAHQPPLGWPCVGAQEACYGLVIARLPLKFKVVPRGSTPSTAKAADEQG